MDNDQVTALIRQRMVHEIHTSERKSFRGCRRRWDWLFKQFYYPKTTAKPLEFGVAFHNAMETLYHPDTWKMPREIVLNAAKEEFRRTCAKQKKKFQENHQEGFFENNVQMVDDYEERIALGIGMLEHFARNAAPDFDRGFTPKKVEVEFVVPINNPDTGEGLICKCDVCWHLWTTEGGHVEESRDSWEGLPVTLAGRLDMLVEDHHGDYWIVDWKTAASISRERGDEFLYLDDQIASYVMALRRKLHLPVRGFIYVEIRKAFPEPPKQNQSRRKGCLYSVSKNQATDFDTYLKTVKENDTEAFKAGYYDDFLTYLQEEGMEFTHRYQIHKTDHELEEIERELFKEVSDMVDPNLRIYPSPGRFSCGFCAFRQPCLEKFAGGDVDYIMENLFDKRRKHYWVKELSTDKQGGE